MEPIKEIKPGVPEKVVEKKSWIKPEIEALDIMDVTKSSPFSPFKQTDGITAYS